MITQERPRRAPIILLVLMIVMAMSIVAEAASIRLQVDPLDQEYDSIRIHMANLPRDFDWNAPPVYVGKETTVTIPGLTPGQTYKFIAVLTRDDKASKGSNIIQEKMPVVVIELKPPVLTAIETRGE
jgi:hypothetical protein